jgi:hypothetical protein
MDINYLGRGWVDQKGLSRPLSDSFAFFQRQKRCVRREQSAFEMFDFMCKFVHFNLFCCLKNISGWYYNLLYHSPYVV